MNSYDIIENASLDVEPLIESSNSLKVFKGSFEDVPVRKKGAMNNFARDRAVANLVYLSGWSLKKVADFYEMTPENVGVILKKEKVKKHIKQLEQDLNLHYDNLFGKFVSTLSDAMDSCDPQIALAGAALYAKTHNRFKDFNEKGLTAEDVIQKLISNRNSPIEAKPQLKLIVNREEAVGENR